MELPTKRQKTNRGEANATQGSYDSGDDSGDEIFAGLDHDTIATLPVQRPCSTQSQLTQLPSSIPTFVTQPTQLIERPTPRSKDAFEAPSVVQVAASSPTRSPRITPVSNQSKLASRGVLASAMAPAGTAFRQPYGVQRAPLPKEVIDLSDDEGPKYQGSSSDERDAARRNFDIKPSTFASSRSSGLSDVGPERVENSPETAMSKFKEITSNSFYRPLEKGVARASTLSGSIFDPRNRDGTSSQSSGPAAKRALVLNAGKQTGPQRARQVEDLSLDTIEDSRLRDKIVRIRRVLPAMTVLTCRNALLEKKGNVEDALELLADRHDHKDEIDLTMSDQDKPIQKQQLTKQSAKRLIKVPARTIQDKYSSTQTRPATISQTSPQVTVKPRRRLVQGKKAAITSKDSSPLRSPSPESLDDSDSGVAIVSDDDLGLESRVLAFFNACSAKDLADIANIGEDVASSILTHRPFSGLGQVRQISGESKVSTTNTKVTKKKKSTKKPIGDRVVDTCLDMWTGYEAVDELVTKCEELGRSVAETMGKWGFNVAGAASNGELEMVSFDETRSSLRDSGVGTPTSSPPALRFDEELDGDLPLKQSTRRQDKLMTKFLGQPSNMGADVVLKDYQLVGLNWLALLFEKQLSCILADEMGLGKTCQVIAFLAHLLEINVKGPHLVVVPGSTLENWLRECRRFCPVLAVEPYYGLEKERAEIRLNIEANIAQINVIVTTYDIATKKIDSKFLRHLRPIVCVYDEGHALKNSSSLRYTALMKIPAKFRLLLTGTPLQNNLRELAALLGFILPNVFSERKEDLEYIFKHRAKTTDSDHAALLSAQRIARAKSMMTPFVLRRKKHQVLKHLPPKTLRVEYCDMTPAQTVIYNDQLARARMAVQSRLDGSKSNESANVMMQLRKAALHPMLFRHIFTDDVIAKMARDCLKEPVFMQSDYDVVLEEMSLLYTDFSLHKFCEMYPKTMAKYDIQKDECMGSGKVSALASLLLEFRANGDRTLVFSQFTMILDILEAVMDILSMQFFRLDGQTKIDQRQDIIDQFYEEKDVPVFLMSTKAGGMGINLACANKVIIFDQSFNPQEDIQAENRAHRVGQQRAVEVIRLVTRGTIEEQIYALGETKLALDERVSGVGNGAVVDAKGDRDGAVEKVGMEIVKELWMKDEAALGGAPATTTNDVAEKVSGNSVPDVGVVHIKDGIHDEK